MRTQQLLDTVPEIAIDYRFMQTRMAQMLVSDLTNIRHKRDSVTVEDFDHFGEVRQRASQPINLIDDNDIDEPGPNVLQQPLQPRSLQGSARHPAVIVGSLDQAPAHTLLALDEGLAG